MSVQVKGLSKHYHTQKAVDDISFEARPGQVLGFLGPNGAGKTTTMKIITGYVPATSGDVLVCGVNVQQAPLEAQRHIGYLPEHNPLYKDMYVREYLAFVAGMYRVNQPTKRIAELVDMTGLGREQHKPIGALSKGYRQRVGLAQAMLHNPDVLILDEPTSGLDPNQLVEIRNLIKELGREKTVIFSTHIMQEVQALCDRVIIIDRGKLVADDTIEHLQTHNKQERRITVAFAQPVPAAQLQKINGVLRVAKAGDERWHLFCAADKDIRAEVFRFAVDKQNPLLELFQESYSVEDVFRQLTKSDVKN